MKKVPLAVAAVLVIAPFLLAMTAAPALADSVDFNFQNGTLSNTSTGVVTGTVTATTLTGPGPQLQVARNGITNLGPFSILGMFTFTTGTFAGGTGTSTTPFEWNAGGAISVTAGTTAMVNGQNLASSTLFTGAFTGIQMAVINTTANNATFTADFVGGNVNAALLAALGFPSTTTGVNGVLTENFVITSLPGAPLTASLSSGDLTLTPMTSTPTPEPGTLLLFGTGLFGVATLVRRMTSKA